MPVRDRRGHPAAVAASFPTARSCRFAGRGRSAMRTRLAALLVITALCAACGRAGAPTEPLRELEKSRAGDLDVVLLTSDDGLTTGKDTVAIEFRSSSDGGLVDVGTVKANATMPMTGMAPMFAPVDVAPTSVPGRYLATSELSMAGEWRLSLEWDGPAGRGSTTFSPAVN
ncbi:MAG: hypothetical protein GEU82_08780 [Luteitalea sp.]|nr:hypothetical protein [Luteitalea sp.]